MNVPGKISLWPFWSFLGQKYIACGDKMVSSELFGLFLPMSWCGIVKFCYMNTIYCLLMNKWIWNSNINFFYLFWTLFVQKWSFLHPNKVFGHLISNCSSELHVSCSESWGSCWMWRGTFGRRTCWPLTSKRRYESS